MFSYSINFVLNFNLMVCNIFIIENHISPANTWSGHINILYKKIKICIFTSIIESQLSKINKCIRIINNKQ